MHEKCITHVLRLMMTVMMMMVDKNTVCRKKTEKMILENSSRMNEKVVDNSYMRAG